MTREWVTLSEAAEWAQKRFESAGRSLSRKTVSRWALDGKVRAVQQGKRWFVQPASLMSFVTDQLNAGEERSESNDTVEAPTRVESASPQATVEPLPSTPTVRTEPVQSASADTVEPDGENVRVTTQRRNARFLRDLNAGVD